MSPRKKSWLSGNSPAARAYKERERQRKVRDRQIIRNMKDKANEPPLPDFGLPDIVDED